MGAGNLALLNWPTVILNLLHGSSGCWKQFLFNIDVKLLPNLRISKNRIFKFNKCPLFASSPNRVKIPSTYVLMLVQDLPKTIDLMIGRRSKRLSNMLIILNILSGDRWLIAISSTKFKICMIAPFAVSTKQVSWIQPSRSNIFEHFSFARRTWNEVFIAFMHDEGSTAIGIHHDHLLLHHS